MSDAMKRLLDAVDDSLTAWDGEEDSVIDEHRDVIEELRQAREGLSDA